MGWLEASVDVSDESFRLHKGIKHQEMRWGDVVRVSAEKVDKITYEENFLIIEDSAGKMIAIGELDKGFRRFEALMRMKLEKLPLDWRAPLERETPAPRRQIWCRDAIEPSAASPR
jgi:hypothetical protein